MRYRMDGLEGSDVASFGGDVVVIFKLTLGRFHDFSVALLARRLSDLSLTMRRESWYEITASMRYKIPP